MDLEWRDGPEIRLTVTLTLDELRAALASGRLEILLPSGPGGRDRARPVDPAAAAPGDAGIAAAAARICARYGPDSNGANALWEFAEAGAAGLGATDLRHALGLGSPAELAGVMRGLWTVIGRHLPGRESLFLASSWDPGAGETFYRMAEPVCRVVLDHYGK